MIDFYPTPVSELSNDEIKILMQEIEDAGILNHNDCDYEFDEWESAAYDRYSALSREHWNRTGPHPSISLVDLSRITNLALGKFIENIGFGVASNWQSSPKIGETMTIREPARFVGSSGFGCGSADDGVDIPAPSDYVKI